MSNPVTPDQPQDVPAKNSVSTWDEVRRMTDELQLEIHLASMEARDRWAALEPRIAAFEQRIKNAGQRAGEAVADELETIWKAVRGLRDDIKGN